MLGAIVGDIIGSVYEGSPIKTTQFPLLSELSFFTDDTVLTIAIADALLDPDDDYLDRHQIYIDKLHDWFCRYPDAGYGGKFYEWADTRDRKPYGSWGNGSAMRVSPVAYAFETLDEVLAEAKITSEVTHDHSDAIEGAQAIAGSVFLARTGVSKSDIETFNEVRFGYDLSEPIDTLRTHSFFDVSCKGSVQQALIAFLASNGYEDAVRLAISLGGDSDTLACMAGSIAEAFYGGVPVNIREDALTRLDARTRDVISQFRMTFPCV